MYYRPTEDNRLLFGANHASEPVEIRMPGIDFDYRSLELAPAPAQLILEAVKDRLPAMRGVQLVDHRIGLISLTADGQPNIGPLAALPGLYLGTNFCSGGFGYHAVGRIAVVRVHRQGTDQDRCDRVLTRSLRGLRHRVIPRKGYELS